MASLALRKEKMDVLFPPETEAKRDSDTKKREREAPDQSGADDDAVVVVDTKRGATGKWFESGRFVAVKDSNGDVIAAKCSLCPNQTYSVVEGLRSLSRHWKEKHSSGEEQARPEAMSTGSGANDIDAMLKLPSAKEDRVGLAIAKWICWDDEPFSAVEKVGFIALMAEVCRTVVVPSRSTIVSKYIPMLYEMDRATLQSELDGADCCALSVDTWTSHAHRTYLGVTVHYLKDWKVRSAMLTMERMFIGRDSQCIKEAIEKTGIWRRKFSASCPTTKRRCKRGLEMHLRPLGRLDADRLPPASSPRSAALRMRCNLQSGRP